MDIANGGLEHTGNILGIQKAHEDCLASAQTEEEKEICDEKYQKDLDKENDRYADEQQSIKEKDKYEAYLCWLLKAWGNPEKEAKKIARSYRNRKDSDYSFDANEVISELINNGLKDEKAIQKFRNDLPSYGVSKDKAEQVAKEYYENGYYTREDFFKEPYFYLVGDEVYCNRQMLIEMGLIDEDEGNNDDDDEEPEKPDHPNINDPNPNNPDHGVPNNGYQVEADVVSKLVISHYKLNESNLSTEQKNKLDRVVSFLNNWPNAKITIVGHTCSLGTNAINNTVGLKRAQQAKLYLVKQGINESRIEVISKGATEPCANNGNETGRLQNRRITFLVK